MDSLTYLMVSYLSARHNGYLGRVSFTLQQDSLGLDSMVVVTAFLKIIKMRQSPISKPFQVSACIIFSIIPLSRTRTTARSRAREVDYPRPKPIQRRQSLWPFTHIFKTCVR